MFYRSDAMLINPYDNDIKYEYKVSDYLLSYKHGLLSRQNGLVDTTDGVMEFYSPSELQSFMRKGFTILLSDKSRKEVFSFLRDFVKVFVTIGADDYRLISFYVKTGTKNNLLKDIYVSSAYSLRMQYKSLVKYEKLFDDLGVFDLPNTSDLFMKDLIALQNTSCTVKDFAVKWHLMVNIVLRDLA